MRAAAPGTSLDEHPLPLLCARQQGYSLRAATWDDRNDRAGLERLARYGLRPPLALGRLTRAADGAVLYQMKRRFSDGTQTLRFAPQEFLLRLCALVPARPRVSYARSGESTDPCGRTEFLRPHAAIR